MSRNLTAIVLAVAAIGTPYLALETEVGRQLTGGTEKWFEETTGSESPADLNPVLVDGEYQITAGHVYGSHSHHDTESLWDGDDSLGAKRSLQAQPVSSRTPTSPGQVAQQPRMAGGPVHDIREVLRFDITPEWVSSHFARVTTVLADLQLDGLRVPVVTGTQPHDVAGTLTYYFDGHGRLQRVVLHGFTGDPNHLAGLLQQHYGMRREPTLDQSVLTTRWNGAPVNVLKVTRAPIIYASDQHERYTVFLELNQPSLAYGISAEARRIISFDRATGRW